jgi:hypothetical protein
MVGWGPRAHRQARDPQPPLGRSRGAKGGIEQPVAGRRRGGVGWSSRRRGAPFAWWREVEPMSSAVVTPTTMEEGAPWPPLRWEGSQVAEATTVHVRMLLHAPNCPAVHHEREGGGELEGLSSCGGRGGTDGSGSLASAIQLAIRHQRPTHHPSCSGSRRMGPQIRCPQSQTILFLLFIHLADVAMVPRPRRR